MNFDLKVDKAAMEKQVASLRETVNRQVIMGTSALVLPPSPKEKEATAAAAKPAMLDV